MPYNLHSRSKRKFLNESYKIGPEDVSKPIKRYTNTEEEYYDVLNYNDNLKSREFSLSPKILEKRAIEAPYLVLKQDSKVLNLTPLKSIGKQTTQIKLVHHN